MGEGKLVPLALTDLSTGEDLLVWGVGEDVLDDLMREVDRAARSVGAVGASTVDLETGIMTASEMNRTWLDESPRVVEEAEDALVERAGAEGGPEDGR